MFKKHTEVLLVIMWPEEAKEDILKAAKKLHDKLLPGQYTHEILKLRALMKDDEYYHATSSQNLRLNRNTPDSHLIALSDQAIRQLYALLMTKGGVTLTYEFASYMSRDDLLLEIQYMRSLLLLGQSYYLDLVLETMEKPEVQKNGELLKLMKARLHEWLDKWDNKPRSRRVITTKFDINMIRNVSFEQ